MNLYKISKKLADGTYRIYRREDNELIGRVHKEGSAWFSRYWSYGGGFSHGPHKTRKEAAEFVFEKNVTLKDNDYV